MGVKRHARLVAEARFCCLFLVDEFDACGYVLPRFKRPMGLDAFDIAGLVSIIECSCVGPKA